jgi:hypothetical protein
MTEWIKNQQDTILTIAFTGLGVAIVPDVVSANPVIVDSALTQATIVKEVVQIVGGILGGSLSIMLLCINIPKFKQWIRQTFKKKVK